MNKPANHPRDLAFGDEAIAELEQMREASGAADTTEVIATAIRVWKELLLKGATIKYPPGRPAVYPETVPFILQVNPETRDKMWPMSRPFTGEGSTPPRAAKNPEGAEFRALKRIAVRVSERREMCGCLKCVGADGFLPPNAAPCDGTIEDLVDDCRKGRA